jgi:hypothetical protein
VTYKENRTRKEERKGGLMKLMRKKTEKMLERKTNEH